MSTGAPVDSNHRSQFPALTAVMMVALSAVADEPPRLTMTQAAETGGVALPRTVIGVASPDGATLPFHVTLAYFCPAARNRPQVFVSIADSWRLVDASELPSPLIVRVDVPARQLQWLMQPDAGCANLADKRRPDATDDAGIRYYRLHAAAAGYATLNCTGQGEESAVAASTSLDVWLSCPAPQKESGLKPLPQPMDSGG